MSNASVIKATALMEVVREARNEELCVSWSTRNSIYGAEREDNISDFCYKKSIGNNLIT
jgi:hypothetical protein